MIQTSLIFDTKTLENWKSQGISAIIISFIQRGCEGTKLMIETSVPSELFDKEKAQGFEGRALEKVSSIQVFAQKDDWEKLEWARITGVGEKWIFTSQSVKRRCGCGESFSFSDEDRLVRDFPMISSISRASFDLIHTKNRNVSSVKSGEKSSVIGRDASKEMNLNVREDVNASLIHTIVDLWDRENILTKIEVLKDTKLVYRGFFTNGSQVNIQFILEENAKLDARFLVAADDAHAQINMEAIVQGNAADAQIEYRAFAFEWAKIQVDSHINILPNLHDVTGHIWGKNIFFTENASISGIPRVSAASDEIRVGHSLAFEQLSSADAFFLQSRGISLRKAQRMLVEAHIHKIFSDFPRVTIEGDFFQVEAYLQKVATQMLK